ncbi:hypothetical protein POJ06DRAFT_222235 [Lipomyces tetrasporus]|uniref:NmrA-like domain-containing protein n=1 Tax=Lipomyces tetrasporus TaxID=54092 RepID=A0AAD7VSM5_9ASCO|nr:uncharacterized protein POJ06DRAFT_222235 [Lipomyces tetrasporus]KAJ8100226.1 hypothetical protein POJ06DRAFT_222235 [Lipomyces tetrasporus]
MTQEYAANQPQGFKNYIENVAIVGVSGNVGKFITEELLRTGKHKVTAITREDSTNILPSGVIVAKVDYNNQSSLVDALRGQDALVITMSVMAPPGQQNRLIEAAATAGVPWVLPNEFGGDPFNKEISKDIFIGEPKAKCRDYIEELGKSSWIAIACGFWYEFSLGGGPDRYGFDFNKHTVTLMDGGNIKICTSTWPQCGRAVAKVLSLKVLPDTEGDNSPVLVNYKNGCVYISSFTINQNDMLDSVLRVTGMKLSDFKVTHTTAKEHYQSGLQLFQKGNMHGFGRLLYARCFFPESNGNFAASKDLHNDILGLPTEDLDEFTKIGIQMSEKGSY